jgi:hypothetical protein
VTCHAAFSAAARDGCLKKRAARGGQLPRVTIVWQPLHDTLQRSSPVGIDCSVHVAPFVRLPHRPRQWKVEKSGGGDDRQVICRVSVMRATSNAHGVPTHPSSVVVPPAAAQRRQPESGASPQLRPPLHSQTQVPAMQLHDDAQKPADMPAGVPMQSAGT